MVRLELSAEADEDLDDIVRYTVEKHGVAQARLYAGGLRERMHELTLRQNGRRVDGLDASLLRVKFESHFIFFRVVAGSIVVARILHERRDIRRHLP